MQLEYQLRTEIEFWHDAIDTERPAADQDRIERMVEARLLAEHRLEALLSDQDRIVN